MRQGTGRGVRRGPVLWLVLPVAVASAWRETIATRAV
jgi:hypothetical protein